MSPQEDRQLSTRGYGIPPDPSGHSHPPGDKVFDILADQPSPSWGSVVLWSSHGVAYTSFEITRPGTWAGLDATV